MSQAAFDAQLQKWIAYVKAQPTEAKRQEAIQIIFALIRKLYKKESSGIISKFGDMLGGIPVLGGGLKGVLKGMGKLEEGMTSIAKKGIAWGINIVGNVALLPLVPFLPAMKRELKAKGVKPKPDILGVAKQFRKYVIAKDKYHYHDMMRQAYVGNPGSPIPFNIWQKQYLEPISVAALVTLIKGYFDKIVDKKAKGEPMTKREEKIYDTVKQAEAQIEKGITEEVDKKSGEFIRTNPWLIVGGIAGIAAVAIMIGRGTK